jgi:hypothetical protein
MYNKTYCPAHSTWNNKLEAQTISREEHKSIYIGMKPEVFRGQTISFCQKPELLESFKFTCWGLKNAGNLLLLDKAIS